MISSKDVHKGIDLGFHVWILFSFLTILFFTFISRKEKDSITRELNSVIDDNVPKVLNNIDKLDQRFGTPIDWNSVNNMAKNIEKKYDGPDLDISVHNKTLLRNAIFISVGILLVLIGVIVYFVHFKKMDIGLGKILLTNFFIIVFVGIIEALFFMNIALKYSPVTSSDMINQLVDRTEYNINEELN
jgi:hypothetical protein